MAFNNDVEDAENEDIEPLLHWCLQLVSEDAADAVTGDEDGGGR
jgi:hypothetical protein